MRISILSNVNLDMLSGILKKENEIFQTDGYGKWITYALNRDERLAAFAPECLFLLLDGNALLESCSDFESGADELERTCRYVKKLAENYPDSYLAVSTIDIRPKRISAGDAPDVSLHLSVYWEKLLEQLTEELPRVHRLELRQLIENCGRNNFYSRKFWYMGSIPYDMKALHMLAGEISHVIARLKRTPKKVLVLDLDNTLWGGVIGEDGPEGIVLDSAHEGAIYQDAQKEIKKMQTQGVLLAIASKNNEADAWEAFSGNPHMILKKEDFAAVRMNWEPKSENIKQMAKELNLGADAFVFVDDNEAEREAMKIQLPEVTVAEFPSDLTQLSDTMCRIYETYFAPFRLTEEDREKTRQYQAEKKRKEEQNTAVSYEDYLKSLETKIRLCKLNPDLKERAVQLMNKTNQFNTCTLRMDGLELEHYIKQQGNLILAEVSDKYGSSGWVAEFFYHVEGTTAVVDNFLMSCRVMGRKIEDAVLAAILGRLSEQGICGVTAYYKKTAKNKPVEELWDSLGFEKIEDGTEEKTYHMNLDAADAAEKLQASSIHTVIWERG